MAGFAGFAERGPLGSAKRIVSWDEFRLIYGGFLADAYLAYAVRGFFACGGTECWVARIGSAQAPARYAQLSLAAALPPPIVTALAAPVGPGELLLRLASSAVVSAGEVIGVGLGDGAEAFEVLEVVDDQSVRIRPPPAARRAAGDPVVRLEGRALQAEVPAGALRANVGAGAPLSPGDLVTVEGRGVSEPVVVVGLADDGTLELGRALAFPHRAGDVVRKWAVALRITARSPGAWGDRIRLQLAALQAREAVTEFSLRVTVDLGPGVAGTGEEEFFPRLSLDPATKGQVPPIYATEVASQLVCLDAPAPGAALLFGSGPLVRGDPHLQGGSDGSPRAGVQTQDFLDALDQLAAVDEIAILAVPDAVGLPGAAPAPQPTPAPKPCSRAGTPSPAARAGTAPAAAPAWSAVAVQQAMLAQCVRLRYRVAVLDPPMDLQPAAVRAWPGGLALDPATARFGALYYPWLSVPDELGLFGPDRPVPPSGHVAGAYAANDDVFGVQRPPANLELSFADDAVLELSDAQQGPLNDAGVNALRGLPGRGIRVWGARSLSPEGEWRFIHRRRLLSMIEDSVEKASRWTVFEPNDASLRRTLVHSLQVFLDAIWRAGGLEGRKPADAYFVRCDATNNPPAVIDAGQLVCQVGVAIAAPMEFIVFDLRRSVEGPQVVEF